MALAPVCRDARSDLTWNRVGVAANIFSGRGCRRVLGGLVGASLLLPAAALGDHGSGSLGVRGVPERKLRAFETEVLGAAHAREHALERRLLRRLDPSTARATSSDGRAAADAPLLAAAVDDGQWSAPFDIPVMAIHATLLPTGKVLWFSYPTNPNPDQGAGPGVPNTAMAWVWDPAAGTGPAAFKRVDPPIDPRTGRPGNIWCAGQILLADGRVLVTGGNMSYPNPSAPVGQRDFKGLDKVYTFNPYNETWTEQPDMAKGRWYPSQVLLPDGRAVIMDGYDETGGGSDSRNPQIEVFTPDPDPDGVGTLSLVTTRADGPPTSTSPPFSGGGIYPHLAVMPSGKTMVFGPYGDDSWWFTLSGDTFDWDETETVPEKHLWGTGVLEPSSDPLTPSETVMLIGGSNPDFAQPTPDYTARNVTRTLVETPAFEPWVTASPLQVARSHHNTVLLPDGSMVTVGGGVGRDVTGNQWAANEDQKQVELWDPVTKTWSLGAAQSELRAYHSTALLLPDGRVVSAGDDFNGGISQDTAEIYEPPYLHTGRPRPVVQAAPPSTILGENFTVWSDDADAVDGAALVAPGATTHANDMHQRYLPLQIVDNGSGNVTLKTPASANVAPPGYYMLFLLADGVPSVAKFIRVDAVADNTAPYTYLLDGPLATVSSNSATFRFTSSEPGSSFECRLDGGAWETCASPLAYSGISDGHHTFEVKASDGVNEDATPAARSWSIDTTPPETTIISGPPPATRAGDAAFGFGASESGSTFACSLDGAPYAACTAPARYGGLADGTHSFSVRASDTLGNVEQSPAAQSWRIDRAAPRGSLRPKRRQTLRSALVRGISETVSCDEACSLTADLLVDARALRRPRASRLTRVARKRATLGRPGRVTLRLRPDRRSRLRLRRAERVTFTLRATITDALGNRRNLAAKLRLR
jgi:hypothetical protein